MVGSFLMLASVLRTPFFKEIVPSAVSQSICTSGTQHETPSINQPATSLIPPGSASKILFFHNIPVIPSPLRTPQ